METDIRKASTSYRFYHRIKDLWRKLLLRRSTVISRDFMYTLRRHSRMRLRSSKELIKHYLQLIWLVLANKLKSQRLSRNSRMARKWIVKSFWTNWWQTNSTSLERFTSMKLIKLLPDYQSYLTNGKMETNWMATEFQRMFSSFNFRNTSIKWLRSRLWLATSLPWEDFWLIAMLKKKRAWISSIQVKEARQSIIFSLIIKNQ